MDLTRDEIKEKLLVIKESVGWGKVGNYKSGHLYLAEVSEEGISHWGYVGEGINRTWTRILTPWEELTDEELESFEKYVKLKYPKEYEVTRNSYLIHFKNCDTTEVLTVNLKDKKFTKTYADPKRKPRDVKYPHSFFKGMNGRVIANKIPSDDNFKKLVDTIIKKESACSNFGTFLVRLFDNIHLETYISAGKKFDYNIKVGYDFFDKDVRNILNKYDFVYDKTVEAFFANNHDIGKSMLAHLKNEENFVEVFKYIASNMRDVNILVENYKYDVKRLFEYCKERNWSTGRSAYYYNSHDLVTYMCDYARMADRVYPNGFDKYPSNIIEWHEGVSELYAREKVKYDEEAFRELADKFKKYEMFQKEKDGLCIIAPETTDEIKEEGRMLVHCVGSYIDFILQGSSIILFLRTKEEKNTPRLTVEVKGKNITQVRGLRNRVPNYDEKVFLLEWADKKNLRYTAAY